MRLQQYSGIICIFLSLSFISVQAATVAWTGKGADDKWSNPDNWQSNIIPASFDEVQFESNVDWVGENRHISVTIDNLAVANKIRFSNYGNPYLPFQNISITAGAVYTIGDEDIDQQDGLYIQTGGEHTVLGDFDYASNHGLFDLQDGIFRVNGILSAYPEHGQFILSGGKLDVDRMHIGGAYGWSFSFAIENNAIVTILDELRFNSTVTDGGLDLSFNAPIIMNTANFVNMQKDAHELKDLNKLNLIFEGDVPGTVNTFEVAGLDLGPEGSNWNRNDGNYAIQLLDLGKNSPIYLKLLDEVDNNENCDRGKEALYVDKLILRKDSVLDLNGYSLYYKELVNEGGTLIDGTPIPEDIYSLTILLSCAFYMLKHSRSNI